MRALPWLLAALTAGCSSEPAWPPPCGVAGEVTASGNAFDFSSSGGRLEGGEVSVLEEPGLMATTDAEGAFSFTGLRSGAEATFVLRAEGRPEIQTATFAPCGADLEHVSFQSPDDAVFETMALFARVTPDPTCCHVATTVTRPGGTLYATEPGAHGEAGATVSIEPPVAAESGPVYFNLRSFDVIFPDPRLEATTDDGGVLFVNVPPGEYTLAARKDGRTFTTVHVKCRAGVLVNASPPWGLNVVQ